MDKLYYTEDYVKGNLVDNKVLRHENTQEIKLTTEESHKLVGILFANTTDLRHRCISVYRDAVVWGTNTYNVCLSCGDFYENNRHYFISKEGIEEFKEFKNELINGK